MACEHTHSVIHNLLCRHVSVADHGEAGLPMYIYTTTLSLPHKPYIVHSEQVIQFASELIGQCTYTEASLHLPCKIVSYSTICKNVYARGMYKGSGLLQSFTL